jgi:hypothetical protein
MTPLQNVYWLRLGFGIVAALVCIGFGYAMGTVYTNVIANPSLESGSATPSYWFSSGNGSEWSNAYARTGFKSIRISVVNASTEWKSAAAGIAGGSTYQILGFFGGEVKAGQFFLTIRWFSDLEGHDLAAENDIPIPVGNYSRWSGLGTTFAAPNGANSCEISFRAVNGTGDLYGDDFEVRQTESITKFVNNISLAIIIYLISYFPIKNRFMSKVDKPQKLFTMGIGIYFISWLVGSVLLYTLLATTAI